MSCEHVDEARDKGSRSVSMQMLICPLAVITVRCSSNNLRYESFPVFVSVVLIESLTNRGASFCTLAP
ncbi:hypothetical protein B0H67DRAFT_580318 [Lasiosphaeris hirsuta]|uniref:Uncharacterized protein n=1 Tax=Lasiosphaeris hirsuta TaxID=260670 RepID=A0AA40AG74_9PEZI|nr:hypothetical protein B0H67DRAFT_580318 [Lasiosphaeris hirsuta]